MYAPAGAGGRLPAVRSWKLRRRAVGKPTLFWSVMVTTSDGFSSVTLHGKDGTLVKRDDVKLK